MCGAGGKIDIARAMESLALSEVEWWTTVSDMTQAFSRCEPLQRLLDLLGEISHHD
jgi:hypothetical protein